MFGTRLLSCLRRTTGHTSGGWVKFGAFLVRLLLPQPPPSHPLLLLLLFFLFLSFCLQARPTLEHSSRVRSTAPTPHALHFTSRDCFHLFPPDRVSQPILGQGRGRLGSLHSVTATCPNTDTLVRSVNQTHSDMPSRAPAVYRIVC